MIKSVGKSEHGCCDHKTLRTISCCAEMREIFVRGEGGLVVCRWGELGLGRRRRNRGGEGRQIGHILTFSDGFTYGLFRRWVRRLFWRKNWHVTVQICHFKSLGNSIGILNGEPVRSPYGAIVLNPSVKITRKNLHVSEPPFFFNSELSVRNSVGNYRRTLYVGSYWLNYERTKFRR